MSDVDKIVELILSDDETNQELGFMMAVSQGLKDEVLKVLHKLVLDKFAEKVNIKRSSLKTFKPIFLSKHFKIHDLHIITNKDAAILVTNRDIKKISSLHYKLKNYNHE